LISRHFGLQVPPNKAIVGANAFAHESGIHVHGVLSNPLTYEPFDPSMLGLQRRIVVGKHSGRHAVEYVLKSMCIQPTKELVDYVLAEVKRLGDSGVRVTYDLIKEIVGKLPGSVSRVAETCGD
ncbi:MAG: hypothetical protein QXF57_03100, partial [Acidilobaceae archaeon]